MADDDLLPPPNPEPLAPPDPQPAPIPARRHSSSVVCEFCGCTLAPSGDVLRRGAEATQFQKQGDKIDRLEADLAAAVQEKDRLQDELRTLKAATARRPTIPL
jgi:hypothetical protein